MTRSCKCGQIEGTPGATYFKPRAVPLCKLEEFEALRLADFEGLYQEDAAGHMGISRQTFANMCAVPAARSPMLWFMAKH
jgi:uncharacterized protein